MRFICLSGILLQVVEEGSGWVGRSEQVSKLRVLFYPILRTSVDAFVVIIYIFKSIIAEDQLLH